MSSVLDPWTYLNVLFRPTHPRSGPIGRSVSTKEEEEKRPIGGNWFSKNDLRWESNLSFFKPNKRFAFFDIILQLLIPK